MAEAVLAPEPERKSEPSSRRLSAPGSAWERPASLALTVALVAASVLYLLNLGRRTTFFYDEWSWVVNRRGWAPHNFLAEHNGHFVALPVLLYHLLFSTAGLRAYLPYRLLLMGFHAATCLLLYFYARRRVDPWLATVAAGSMCLIGAAYQNLVWPFQMTLIGALALGLGAWLALDHAPSRTSNGLALLLLLGSISCSGAGLSMLAGAAVLIACRRQWQRWWVPAVPVGLFLGWYLRYGRNAFQHSTLRRKVHYVFEGFRSGVAALTGHPYNQAVTLATWLSIAIVLLALGRLAWALVRERNLPAGLLAAAATAVSLWGLTAISRGGFNDYGSSRYMYGAALVVVLLIVESLRSLPAPRLLAAGLAAASLVAVNTGLDTLRPGTKSLANVDTYVRADLAAVQQLRQPTLGYQINKRFVPTLTVGQYLSVYHDLGSPAMPFAAVPSQSPGVRNDVDRILREAGGLSLTPATKPATTAVTGSAATLSGLTGCYRFDGGTLQLPLPSTGLIVAAGSAPVQVWLHRFGPTNVRYGLVTGDSVDKLTAQPDALDTPWLVQLRANGLVEVCSG